MMYEVCKEYFQQKPDFLINKNYDYECTKGRNKRIVLRIYQKNTLAIVKEIHFVLGVNEDVWQLELREGRHSTVKHPEEIVDVVGCFVKNVLKHMVGSAGFFIVNNETRLMIPLKQEIETFLAKENIQDEYVLTCEKDVSEKIEVIKKDLIHQKENSRTVLKNIVDSLLDKKITILSKYQEWFHTGYNSFYRGFLKKKKYDFQSQGIVFTIVSKGYKLELKYRINDKDDCIIPAKYDLTVDEVMEAVDKAANENELALMFIDMDDHLKKFLLRYRISGNQVDLSRVTQQLLFLFNGDRRQLLDWIASFNGPVESTNKRIKKIELSESSQKTDVYLFFQMDVGWVVFHADNNRNGIYLLLDMMTEEEFLVKFAQEVVK